MEKIQSLYDIHLVEVGFLLPFPWNTDKKLCLYISRGDGPLHGGKVRLRRKERIFGLHGAFEEGGSFWVDGKPFLMRAGVRLGEWHETVDQMGTCPGSLEGELQAERILAGLSCLRDICSSRLSPCLSIKGRIGPPFSPARDTSQLDCEETANERLSPLPSIYTSDRQDTLLDLTPKYNHLVRPSSLGTESPLQPPSLGSIIPWTYKAFLSLSCHSIHPVLVNILPLPIRLSRFSQLELMPCSSIYPRHSSSVSVVLMVLT